MSAAELEDHARAYWVKLPYGDYADLQEWWPAMIYRNTIEAMSYISDTKICAQLFSDQWRSDFNQKRVALLLGDIDDDIKNYVLIDDIHDESHVVNFFNGFGQFCDPSNLSPSLRSAIDQAVERFKTATETKPKEHENKRQTNNNRVAKGRKSNKTNSPKRQQVTSQQYTPPPAHIVTNTKRPRSRASKDSDCSSLGNNSTPQKNKSTPISSEVQSISSPNASAQFISNGYSDTTNSFEENQSAGPMDATPYDNESSFSANPSAISSVKENDSWKDTWDKLKTKGWTWKKGSALIDFYYIPPKGNIDGEENVDYFTSADNVMEYFFGKKEPAQSRSRTKKPSKTSIETDTREAKKSARAPKQSPEPDEESVYSYYAPSVYSETYQPGEIGPNDPWTEVYSTLTKSKGWTYKAGGGTISWYYIPPGGKIPSRNCSAIENQDYFTNEDKMKAYVMEKYGWKGDPVEPLFPTDFHLDTDFKETWRQLRIHGWKYNEAKQIYLAPCRSSTSSGTGSRRRGGQEGVDFFKTRDDVVKFLMPFLKKVRSTKTMNSTKKTNKRKFKTPGKKREKIPVKKRGRSGKFDSSNKKRKSTNAKIAQASDEDSTELINDDVIQRTEGTSDESSTSDDSVDERIVRPGEVIKDKEAWNILQRVFKFRYVNRQYHMPEIDPNRNKLANRDYFSGLLQLRKHLCSHGIPLRDGFDVDDEFYKKRVNMPVIGHGKMALVRYLAMTNVPLKNPTKIPDTELLSNEEAMVMLKRDCLEQNESSLTLMVANEARKFNKIEDLKSYICRFGFEHHSYSADEHLKISLWAADSVPPNFFNKMKEATTIDVESTTEPPPVSDSNYVVLHSPSDVSALQSPATSPNKKEVSNESEGLNKQPENMNSISLTPIEHAKENMSKITLKGGQPVLKDDNWINVLEKMKFTGWNHINGKGLHTDAYILPNGSIKGKENVDYLTSEYDAKHFAVENFGWGGDVQYIEEKERRTLGTPGRKTRSPQPNIMTLSTPRKRPLYTDSKTPPSKRGRNIAGQSENTPSNIHTPQGQKVDPVEASSIMNITPPTRQIVCVEPRGNMDTVSPIPETAVVTEFKKDKPQGLATVNVQRNLSGAFDEQMTIGKKLMRCQLALQTSYDMCMKHYYQKLDNVTSISGFLTGISQSIATGQTYASPKLLHILGSPGVGKTSTVRMCIQDVRKQSQLKKLSMIIWNAASIKSSNDLFSKLSIQMGLNEYAGVAVIEKRLKAKNSLFVAVIDEVDLILHRDTRGLRDFFQWSYSPEFNFSLILISNTHENQKIAALLPTGWDISSKKTIVFHSYDKNDLSNMLKLRVHGPVFEDKALNYIATKAAADGGDARRALSIASRSITKYANTLSAEEKKELFSTIISKERASISFKHVRMAITELDKGGSLESIASLPPAAKIALAVATALSCAPNSRNRIITRGMLVHNCRLVASRNIVNVLGDVASHWVSDVLDQLSDSGLLQFGGDDSDCHSPSDEKLELCVNPLDVECSLEEVWPQEGYYRRIASCCDV